MNDMVSIPRAEYERLLTAAEELAGIAAYDAAMRDRREGIPDALVARIIEGEAPLAVLRAWRGLSQAALARASGVSRVQIVEIEAGRASGSVATLRKLADALNLTLDDLA